MPSKQKVRRKQFDARPTVGFMSFVHVTGANTLLAAALEERRGDVYRYAFDHASFNAPSAIQSIVTAFDAWLTETIAFVQIDRAELADAKLPTCAKYDALCRHLRTPAPSAVGAELERAVDLRDEVVHFLPRSFGGDLVPEWFASLEQRGLFFGAGEGRRWQFNQRLCGYRLAYWTFGAVESAVLAVRDGASGRHAGYLGLSENFSIYRRTTPPEALALYDLRFKLALTEPPWCS